MTPSGIAAARKLLVERLLQARNPQGHWTGELSNSALSTATASIALTLAGDRQRLAARGLDWLERNRNADGGWGDTPESTTNISTTCLCWSAFLIAGCRCDAEMSAEAWIERAAGGLEPEQLVKAIAARYGSDRTFSVPILTVLALAGRIPWRTVPQLPFELASLPQSWFRWLQLPVVSYALPALIAIGQVRHRNAPSWNLAARALRGLSRDRTLRVLEQIQPGNGGFLEATPLTSFVAMSLLASGSGSHRVAANALRFLETSIRPDGSWPIDTNLATWLTTLSVNALREELPPEEREQVREWLLGQQYRTIHPYTGAPPGGWAWTNLPGGVPDADDTAGALLALAKLGSPDGATVSAAEAGAGWLLDLQNRDGGVPTFCRGWGTLPFDRSSADITAHALLAWRAWEPHLSSRIRTRIALAMPQALHFLKTVQRPDGAWVPLWFGNQFAADDQNPVYGTSRVLLALAALEPSSDSARRGADWLLRVQNADGGWGGDAGVPSSLEESSLAIAALAALGTPHSEAAAGKGAGWLVDATRGGECTPPSPIGLYFARLWYHEKLYPVIFALDALARVGTAQRGAAYRRGV